MIFELFISYIFADMIRDGEGRPEKLILYEENISILILDLQEYLIGIILEMAVGLYREPRGYNNMINPNE